MADAGHLLGLVLIDFARLRAGGDGLTPVQMATSIYLDAINIFLALLQIFGGRRSLRLTGTAVPGIMV